MYDEDLFFDSPEPGCLEKLITIIFCILLVITIFILT